MKINFALEAAYMFGLVKIGDEDNYDAYEGRYRTWWNYQFHNRKLNICQGMGDDEAWNEEEADQMAAEWVFKIIGRTVAG